MARQLEPIEMSAGATRIVSIDCTPQLDSGEALGTVAITDADSLTITNAAVSNGSLVIKGRTVASGKAVQFLVSNPSAGSYNVVFTVTTDSTPAQTQKWDLPINVV